MPIAQSTKVGIIYPPPEVRTIVDKTASFVARNGPEFQEKIRQNEISNPKFNFLNENDPYHAYYKHKVNEFEENKGLTPDLGGTTTAVQKLNITSKTQEQQTKLMEQMFVPKDPPPEFEYICEAPSITPLDIDVIKLTAQFVARNGRPFLTSLMNKEQRNALFDFLKPQHSHFNYFTRLVEQYTKMLLPQKEFEAKLRRELNNPSSVLKDIMYRVEWCKYQQREKAREDEILEKERVAYAQIDWHDFVVVETVDYQANEMGNFPPPTTPQDVGARVVAQERVESYGGDMHHVGSTVDGSLMERIIQEESEVNYNVVQGEKTQDTNIDEVAMDEDSDENEEAEVTSASIQQKANSLTIPSNVTANRPAQPSGPMPNLPMPRADLPFAPNPDKVIIRKDYDPRARQLQQQHAKAATEFISPMTGLPVSADDMTEHIRISLLDPKWLEQKEKERREREEQDDVFAPGVNVDKQIKDLAEFRRDIFGRGADEAVIGKKIGEEEDMRRNDHSVWDGHSNTMEATTRRAMSGITVEDQIKAIHQSQGIYDDSSMRIGPAIVPPKPPSAQSTIPSLLQQQPNYTYQYSTMKPVDSSSVLLRPPGAPPQNLMLLQQNQQLMRMPQQAPTLMLSTPPTYMQQPPPLLQQQQQQQPPPPLQPAPPVEPAYEEPPSKRIKTEDQLTPEEEFLAQNGGPTQTVSFNLQVPLVPDKGEWSLNGQTITFTMQLGDQISAIKTKLFEILTMPIAKQKLQLDGMFIKDSNTLAYYNVTRDSTILLQLKERGGRKN